MNRMILVHTVHTKAGWALIDKSAKKVYVEEMKNGLSLTGT